ncbi:MAG: hypothetical protein GIKADHBN_02460 [Phycisphaerales bacterium]|nr:hypothetical protein [Phycisphaerales bacterium]
MIQRSPPGTLRDVLWTDEEFPVQTSSPNIIHPTADTFDREVGGSAEPVLVDFWAPWCPPCLALKPIVQKLATELVGKAKIAFVNVDEQPELAQRFGIQSIPALFIVHHGAVVDSFLGYLPREALLAKLQPHLASDR